jgi:hypothetical protein
MSEEQKPSAAGLDIAKQIRATDRSLGEAEQRNREAARVEALTRTGGAPSPATGRDARDREHQRLLDDRTELMEQLELLDGDT